MFTLNDLLVIVVMFCVFVVIMVVFAISLTHRLSPIEGFANNQNMGSTARENIDYTKLITSLTDWGLHANKLIYVNKIVPSFGFTKIREYISKCIDDVAPKDTQQLMADIQKQISKQRDSEGFKATFEETELVNELEDIVGR